MKTQEREVYGSDPLGYDFEAALANAKTAEPKSGLTAEQLYWRTHWPEAPDAEQLRRHHRAYGAESVNEIAAVYDVGLGRKIKDEKKPARQRRTTAELRAQVLGLRDRGVLPTAIADSLNLSDARVKGILAAQAS